MNEKLQRLAAKMVGLFPEDFKSAQNCYDQFRVVYKKQFDYFAKNNIKNIKIADELFVLNPNHFIKICDLIIERGYKFNIWAYSRIDTCKPQYLEKLKMRRVFLMMQNLLIK